MYWLPAFAAEYRLAISLVGVLGVAADVVDEFRGY
jgi:hypothetical protein